MPFTNSHIRIRIVDAKDFATVDPLIYQGRDHTFMVPPGFETDFATVPRIITWLLPTYGLYTLAAILHDYFCIQLKEAWKRGETLATVLTAGGGTTTISSRDVDGMFRRIMRELGVPLVRRWLLWTGVRLGAIASPYRRRGSIKTLPLVAMISILALPFLIIPTLVVGLALAIDYVMELFR